MIKEYTDMFSEWSGHSGSTECENMVHKLFSFAGCIYK